MCKLVVIRHSVPDLDFGRPACEWRLSDRGRRRCRPLAQWLADQDLAMLSLPDYRLLEVVYDLGKDVPGGSLRS